MGSSPEIGPEPTLDAPLDLDIIEMGGFLGVWSSFRRRAREKDLVDIPQERVAAFATFAWERRVPRCQHVGAGTSKGHRGFGLFQGLRHDPMTPGLTT